MTDNFDISFKKTILKSDLPAVIRNAGEIALDSLFDSGVLKNIPILNTLLQCGNTVGNIRDYLFAKKMLKFFENISNLSEAERKNGTSLLTNLMQTKSLEDMPVNKLLNCFPG